jgi:hypothetical protein
MCVLSILSQIVVLPYKQINIDSHYTKRAYFKRNIITLF